VAVAGPAVNVVIAAVLAAWLELTDGWMPVEELTTTGGSFFQRLLLVNVFLVLFNLIPAFPMDGGRVLRALLAMRMEYVRATQVAASIGQALAFGFGFLGLTGSNPFLVFIAFFVWIGASQEATMVQTKAALSGVALERVMITDFQTMSPSDSLGRAIELTLAGSQKDFPVLDGGELVGVLTQDRLLKALAHGGPGQRVDEVMVRDFEHAELSEMIEPVFRRLQTCDCRTIPVMRAGILAGLVTMDNVGEYLRIHSALTE
jgi:CBS domain-containing protein